MDHCEIPRWKLIKSSLRNLSYEEFIKSKPGTDTIYIDARTPEEYEAFHLPNAININYLSDCLVDLLEELDPQKHYYVYCRTSRRSLRICVLLRNMGFQNVYHLGDGLKDHL